MARYSGSGEKAYDHACIKSGGTWQISYSRVIYFKGREAEPVVTRYNRVTDEHGARRFCALHGLEFPSDACLQT